MSYQAWLLDHDEGAWVPEVDRLEYFGDPTSFDDGVDYFHISVSAMSGELSDTEPFLTERLSDLDSAMLRDHTDDREAEGEFALDPHPYDVVHRGSDGEDPDQHLEETDDRDCDLDIAYGQEGAQESE